jgi:ferredoxin
MNAMYAQNIVLHYPRRLIEQPVISNLVKNFDLTVNISSARIGQDEEGSMAIEMSGTRENIRKGLDYLTELGIGFKPVSKVIEREDERCISCGACTAVCPSGALCIRDRASMEVLFDQDRCIGCGLCIPACPYQAMVMHE